MSKTVISVAEITAQITRVLEKHPECAKVWPPQIFWHKEGGRSDWDINIFANSDADAEACDDCIWQAVQALRAKYKVLEPG